MGSFLRSRGEIGDDAWVVDFVSPLLRAELQVVSGKGHYEALVPAIRGAKRSVWIATANLKELQVEVPRLGRRTSFRSVLEDFDQLAARGVELRLLHASPPSGPFREAFDRMPHLVAGGLELRACPRNHLKLVIIDGTLLYLGSANFTGAGLGVKGEHRRNFELGILTRDEALLDETQALFDAIWRGEPCAGCRLRDRCEMPLDER